MSFFFNVHLYNTDQATSYNTTTEPMVQVFKAKDLSMVFPQSML
jgi:hypothetical protein